MSDVTSNSGTSLWWTEYTPYGAARASASTSQAPTNLFRFTGAYLDTVTGLYHLRARQYYPATGRFLTVDPVSPAISDPYVGSYVYVGNNPVNLVDPSGRESQGATPRPEPGPPPPPLAPPGPVDPEKLARCYGIHLATAGGSVALAEIEYQLVQAHRAAGPNPIAQLILLIGDASVFAGELLLLANEIKECW